MAGGGCCGALSHHLNADEEARAIVRRNIDAWWPLVHRGLEAIVVTASGCGVMVKDYGHFLGHEAAYAAKAKKIAELARDPIEIVTAEWKKIAPLIAMDQGPQRISFHSPCTLQHGMKIRGQVEEILLAIGHSLLPVADAHLCCGSAGTYSVLQPVLAGQLKDRQAEGAGGVATGRDRVRQRRLHDAPAIRDEDARAPLDRAARRANAQRAADRLKAPGSAWPNA